MGTRLQLRDSVNEELAEHIQKEDQEISISSEKLCPYLADAERHNRGPRPNSRSKHTIEPGAVKRLRSVTPPAMFTSNDGARYQDEEERAAKRTALNDRG